MCLCIYVYVSKGCVFVYVYVYVSKGCVFVSYILACGGSTEAAVTGRTEPNHPLRPLRGSPAPLGPMRAAHYSSLTLPQLLVGVGFDESGP